jgi:hypothetical protein
VRSGRTAPSCPPPTPSAPRRRFPQQTPAPLRHTGMLVSCLGAFVPILQHAAYFASVPYPGGPASCPGVHCKLGDVEREHLCRSAGVMGEYRTIMNLCRVLPDGLDCKTAVDEAIDCCNDIGACVAHSLSKGVQGLTVTGTSLTAKSAGKTFQFLPPQQGD